MNKPICKTITKPIIADYAELSKWLKLQNEMDEFDRVHGIGQYAKPARKK
jgi:glutaredoxin-related protein